MWSVDRLKHLGIRALVDVLVLGAIGAVVVVVLWAYHGQQAYTVIKATIEAQQTAHAPAK